MKLAQVLFIGTLSTVAGLCLTEKTTKDTGAQRSLIVTVLLLTLARLVVNIGRRFTYPFIPAISRDLGVAQTSVQSVVSLQAAVGITSPAFGPLAERFGRKRVMVGALLLMAGAAVLGAAVPRFGIYALVMVLLGVGKMIFDPAMQAYIGDRVPYHRRGMALGATELAWAGSLGIAAPVVGWLLDAGTLRAVFVALATAAGLAALLVLVTTPADHPGKVKRSEAPISPLAALRVVGRSSAARAALGYALLISLSNEILFVNYGAFMETSFGLTAAALGVTTTVIAAAEVCGEFTVIGLADRYGKRRLAVVGAVVASVAYLLFTLSGGSLILATAALFVMFLGTETAIVAAIPLYTEILPDSRSIMLSSTVGAGSAGRLLGSLVGAGLYGYVQNFVVLGAVSLCIGLMAAALLWRYVVEAEA